MEHVVPIVQTGDLHIAIYDLTDNAMFVANAAGKGETGPKMACDRAFVRPDMAALFNTQPRLCINQVSKTLAVHIVLLHEIAAKTEKGKVPVGGCELKKVL